MTVDESRTRPQEIDLGPGSLDHSINRDELYRLLGIDEGTRSA